MKILMLKYIFQIDGGGGLFYPSAPKGTFIHSFTSDRTENYEESSNIGTIYLDDLL